MALISIKREGTAVQVTIDCGCDHYGNPMPSIVMKWEAHSDLFAALLADRVRDQFNNMLKGIRKESYLEGWQNAKSKKGAKRDWFSGHQP